LTRRLYIRDVDVSERGIRLVVTLVAILTIVLLALPVHA